MWDLRKRINSHTPNVHFSVQMCVCVCVCVCVRERGCRPHPCQNNSISHKDKMTTLIDENIIKLPFPANELINLQRKQTFTSYFHMQNVLCDDVCVWMENLDYLNHAQCVCVCVNVPRGCCNGQWVSNGNQFPLTTHFSIFYETGGCICVCLWGDVIMWCSSQTMITETRQNTHHLKLLDTDGSLWLLTTTPNHPSSS